MKSVLTVFALLASCVCAQTASLKTALYALTSSDADRTLVTKQLADAIMPLARISHAFICMTAVPTVCGHF